MIVIADSGATKVDWRLIDKSGGVTAVSTIGLSPIFMSEDEIFNTVKSQVAEKVKEEVTDVFFYGAGVVGEEIVAKLTGCFSKLFHGAQLFVESDLLAAARALCGHQSGIACILGTGSNSCYYDGETVIKNVKAGGFILGDEASGAYFGKRLLSDFVKGILPSAVEKELVKRYNLDYPSVVQRIYKQEQPSRYLASFAPFINEFRNHPHISTMIKSGFEEFLMRNVAQYEYRRFPVNFVGSIAYNFKDILEKSVSNCNMRMGVVIQSPIEGLVKYHTESVECSSVNSVIDKSIKAIMAEADIKEYGLAKELLMKFGSVKKAVECYKSNV